MPKATKHSVVGIAFVKVPGVTYLHEHRFVPLWQCGHPLLPAPFEV